MSSWTEKVRCSHGIPFSEECEKCEIIGLEESLKWMTRAVKRNEKRLAELLEKHDQRPDFLKEAD